ncbi:STN domain-containing protein [Pseudomonas luteola]|uniref:STN domain-containing protein n=1 Tax=Pseudomonas luteola TaxID=47886 RepID=A0ABS0MWX2_PSELU|nr:STN domain-containing protein [Pseudomonas luteola]MBH3440975.1 STN domain-containing protein [Pseudomonas luteola]
MKTLLLGLMILGRTCQPTEAACQRNAADFNYPSQRLDEAIQQLAHSTGCPVTVDLAPFADRKVPALHGRYTPEEALWQLIKGTGLEGYSTADGLEANTQEQDAVGAKAQAVRSLINTQKGSITKAKQQHYEQQIKEVETNVAALARQQGFISAGERSSFHRSLDEMLNELKR